MFAPVEKQGAIPPQSLVVEQLNSEHPELVPDVPLEDVPEPASTAHGPPSEVPPFSPQVAVVPPRHALSPQDRSFDSPFTVALHEHPRLLADDEQADAHISPSPNPTTAAIQRMAATYSIPRSWPTVRRAFTAR